MKLRDALDSCSTGLVRRIAERNSLQVAPETLRGELVPALADLLPKRAATGDLWTDLEPAARMVIDLVAARGQHERQSLARRIAWRLGFEGPSAGIDRIIDDLVDRGLMYLVLHGGSGRAGAYCVVPDELRETLSTSTGRGPLRDLRPRSAPQVDRASDPAFDFFTLVSALRRERWGRLGRGLRGGAPRTLAQLLRSRELSRGSDDAEEVGRWRLLLGLGVELGAIERSSRPIPVDERVIGLLVAPRDLARRLAETYLDRRIGRRSGSRAVSSGHGELGSGLEVEALSLVGELPATAWYSVDEVADRVRRELATWTGPELPPQEMEFAILRWAGGPWRWLGLVSGGRDADGAGLLRVTALGVEVARGDGKVDGSWRPSPCLPGPDLELNAPLTADLATLYELERYLALVDQADVRRYRLTPAAFARGLRHGGSQDEALSLLERLLDRPVPDRWVEAMSEWQRWAPFRLEAAFVLRSDDPTLLDALEESPEVESMLGERLGPAASTVQPERLGSLLALLDGRGSRVNIQDGVWLEPRRASGAAALGSAELLWVVLQALDTIDAAHTEEKVGARNLKAVLESLLPVSERRRLAARADGLARRLRAPARRAARGKAAGSEMV